MLRNFTHAHYSIHRRRCSCGRQRTCSYQAPECGKGDFVSGASRLASRLAGSAHLQRRPPAGGPAGCAKDHISYGRPTPGPASVTGTRPKLRRHFPRIARPQSSTSGTTFRSSSCIVFVSRRTTLPWSGRGGPWLTPKNAPMLRAAAFPPTSQNIAALTAKALQTRPKLCARAGIPTAPATSDTRKGSISGPWRSKAKPTPDRGLGLWPDSRFNLSPWIVLRGAMVRSWENPTLPGQKQLPNHAAGVCDLATNSAAAARGALLTYWNSCQSWQIP